MMRDMKPVTLLALLLSVIAIGLVACSNDERGLDEDFVTSGAESAAFDSRPAAAPAPAAAAAPAPPRASASAAPAPAPAPSAVSKQSVGLFGLPGNPGIQGPPGSPGQSGSNTPEVQLVSQRRIIIRTVDMTLIVPDVIATLEDISTLAKRFEGWVVSSDRTLTHRGFISIRVPEGVRTRIVMEF